MWTVSWWARQDQLGASKGMVVGGSGTIGDFIWLNDSQRGLRFRNSAAVSSDFYAPKDSGLHHYALVAGGAGNLSLFIDGQFSEALAGTTTFTIDSIGEAFPTSSSNFNFLGWLDEIRIFDIALDPTRIAALVDLEAPEQSRETPDTVLVFLLGGQSNAVGHGSASALPREPIALEATKRH